MLQMLCMGREGNYAVGGIVVLRCAFACAYAFTCVLFYYMLAL